MHDVTHNLRATCTDDEERRTKVRKRWYHYPYQLNAFVSYPACQPRQRARAGQVVAIHFLGNRPCGRVLILRTQVASCSEVSLYSVYQVSTSVLYRTYSVLALSPDPSLHQPINLVGQQEKNTTNAIDSRSHLRDQLHAFLTGLLSHSPSLFPAFLSMAFLPSSAPAALFSSPSAHAD